jgi:hypothetical protein
MWYYRYRGVLPVQTLPLGSITGVTSKKSGTNPLLSSRQRPRIDRHLIHPPDENMFASASRRGFYIRLSGAKDVPEEENYGMLQSSIAELCAG